MKDGRMEVLILILISIILGTFGQIAQKMGMNIIGKIDLKDVFSMKIFSIITQKYVFLGIVLYLFASVTWLVVLSKEEVSYAYPLIGLGYVFVAIISKLVFNENLTYFRLIGIILITVGAYFVITKL
jgi:multidrug transporter EmrE-like cation transporter